MKAICTTFNALDIRVDSRPILVISAEEAKSPDAIVRKVLSLSDIDAAKLRSMYGLNSERDRHNPRGKHRAYPMSEGLCQVPLNSVHKVGLRVSDIARLQVATNEEWAEFKALVTGEKPFPVTGE